MARKKLIKVRSDTLANWTSINPVLEIGEPYFVTDTGEHGIGNGVAFNSRAQGIGPSNASMAYVIADVPNATQVLADVTGLTFPVLASASYIFEFGLHVVSSVATNGIAVAINGPAAPTFLRWSEMAMVSGSAINAGGQTALDTAVVNTAAVAVANGVPLSLTGLLVNGVNAGTLALRFRSEEVAPATVTVQRGSWGRLTRVA